jgi:hypothetical protein
MELFLDVGSLQRAAAAGHNLRYRFFWGHHPRADGALSDACLSQWWSCTTTAARHMTAQRSGEIVLLSSTAARESRHQMGGFPSLRRGRGAGKPR